MARRLIRFEQMELTRIDTMTAGFHPAPALEPERLRRRCGPESIEEHPEAPGASVEGLGQDRAVEALRFAVAMPGRDYHVFASGPAGVGRHVIVRRLLEERAASDPVPPDLCYVSNFADPYRPAWLRLPAGDGAALRTAMEQLVTDLRRSLRAAFRADDYRARAAAIRGEEQRREKSAIDELGTIATSKGLSFEPSEEGYTVQPLRDGKVLEQAVFDALPAEEKARYETLLASFHDDVESTLHAFPDWRRDSRNQVRGLRKETGAKLVRAAVDEVRARKAYDAAVRHYLDEVEKDLVENLEEFVRGRPAAKDGVAALPIDRRYGVNVLVDNAGRKGAPVVYEDHPRRDNLTGRIEHFAILGSLITDFGLIRPGALHRANGGYLVLDARRILSEPFAWDALKRALRGHEARIESTPEESAGAVAMTLDPDPVPIQLKVVLIGDDHLQQLLAELDPDFTELFTVPAEFDEDVPWTDDFVRSFARTMARLAREDGLLALDRGAMARMVEEAARGAGRSTHLSVRLRALQQLLRESDHWARAAGASAVSDTHVRKALEQARYRSSRLRERVLEEIECGDLRVETAGNRTGQVNGLAVIESGGFVFGHPVRITARVQLGRGRILDVEREVALGGRVHSKGVLILQGFLGGRYASEVPLPVAASIVSEQSYGPIEGDSASLAELCALLSSLAEAPVHQAIAVTGSVDQLGNVQAVGAVNEKIEGFFDVCVRRGLDGTNGVIIPASNVHHLMLRDDVVDAARAGRFRVWAVQTVDEALEILCDVPAGTAAADSAYPQHSLNRRVQDRLRHLAETTRRFRAASR